MLDIFKKVRDLLDRRGRNRALLVLGMIVIMAILETAGVASIIPFVAVLGNPSLVETNRYLKSVYDGLGFATTQDFFVFLGVAVFVVTVGSTVFKALTTWAILRFNGMNNYTLSRRLFKGYLHQPYVWFLRRHSSDLAKTVLSEVGEVVDGALICGMQLVAYTAVACMLIVLLVYVEPMLALTVATVLGGAYGLILWSTRRYLPHIGKNRVKANRERYRVSHEAMGGIKDLKVLGMESAFLERFEKPSLRLVKYKASALMIQQIPRYALQAIAFGGILLIVQYQLVTRGSLGEALPLIALYAVAGYRLLPALQNIYQNISKLRFSKPALDALHRNLLENQIGSRTELFTDPAGMKPVELRERLDLRNVTFRYPGAPSAALDRVTISIAARTTVGLVGQTGSGKTTAIDVMLGLLEPTEGLLVVDGAEITAENQRAWQRRVGYVPQQIFLADDTIAANIAFGVPHAEIDKAAVEQAASIARLHAFVVDELALGYDTLIGERGVRLSGGQRQRVGIARALYRNPDILIMDEATSALDTITERAVMDAVGNLEHQKTIILVAHRLSTVRRCDNIFLFEHGKIVGSGSYDELVDQSAHFQTMVASG